MANPKLAELPEEDNGKLHPHQISSAADAKRFALAGKATMTLVSKRTGDRFTFQVSKPSAERSNLPIYFVSLLTGPANENDFTYLGVIRPQSNEFTLTAKSKVGPDAPSFQAFNFFWRWVVERNELPKGLEVWHEGRCGACGRKLTVPSSIANGIGPECAKKGGLM